MSFKEGPHDGDEEVRRAREGIFDEQLVFGGAPVPGPLAIPFVIKRNGSQQPFDKMKIAQSIMRAAENAGGCDSGRAESLASGVTIYLAKTIEGHFPTADQVDDAVEKVLVEMGHTRIAQAYARHRDRRARVRSLLKQDADVLRSDLAEARRAKELETPFTRESVFVRTSTEKLLQWDRQRIVDALIRETGLDEETAGAVAADVEQQVVAARIGTLTAALIRELVNAKLLERGLEQHWRRHARLGVPLYDAERIIRGVNAEGAPLDPEATGRTLAESVKREFALSQVLSADVADAHISGDLYVHHLESIDRLHSVAHSIGGVAKFGVGLPDSSTFSRPPKYPETLLAQMVNLSSVLQNHFAEDVVWPALNVYFAPFIEKFDERALRQFAQMLIYEYAYRAVVQGERGRGTEIHLCWNVPSHLCDAEATGPGGLGTGQPYEVYTHAAQRFAWALLDVLREGGVGGTPFPAPRTVVHLSPLFFRSQGCEAFLAHAASTAARAGTLHFLLDRDSWLTDGLEPWECRDVTIQQVTVNMPRAVYRAGGHDPAEWRGRAELTDRLYRELERVIQTAAHAHAQKRDFVERLFGMRSVGPFGLLTVLRNDRPYVDLQRARYTIGLVGLNDCIRAVTGYSYHESDEARAFSMTLMEMVRHICAEWSDRLGMQLVPAHTNDPAVGRRFALLDLEMYTEGARAVLAPEPKTQDLRYTPGLRLPDAEPLNPMERCRLEGPFHEIVPAGATSVVRMPDTETSQRSIADFLRKAYLQTGAYRIAVLR